MKNVMSKAWEIAREGAKKFGGSAKEYFAQALRMAWAIIKKGVSKLVKIELGMGSNKYKTWVAEITGLHAQYKFNRTFLKENDGFRCDEFILSDGKYYEICDRNKRYFAKVLNGEVITVDESEVLANF